MAPEGELAHTHACTLELVLSRWHPCLRVRTCACACAVRVRITVEPSRMTQAPRGARVPTGDRARARDARGDRTAVVSNVSSASDLHTSLSGSHPCVKSSTWHASAHQSADARL
eukprot:6192606-Pleurochrysis_carterae.AAC.1